MESSQPGSNLKVLPRHLPSLMELRENLSKPQLGWLAAGFESVTFRMRSKRSTIEPRPLGPN